MNVAVAIVDVGVCGVDVRCVVIGRFGVDRFVHDDVVVVVNGAKFAIGCVVMVCVCMVRVVACCYVYCYCV